MTFTSLQDDLRNYAERGSSTFDETVSDQLPRIVNITERRMARELKIQGFIRAVTSAFVISTAVYQKPDRWRETISMNFGSGSGNNTRGFLRELSYEAATVYWPTRDSTGTPRFYADYDYDHWLIVPTPAAANPYEVVYWELPPLLDDTNTQNWITDYAPNALLHGCLEELYGFLANPEKAAEWRQQYDRNMAALAGEDLQKILDRYYQRRTS